MQVILEITNTQWSRFTRFQDGLLPVLMESSTRIWRRPTTREGWVKRARRLPLPTRVKDAGLTWADAWVALDGPPNGAVLTWDIPE